MNWRQHEAELHNLDRHRIRDRQLEAAHHRIVKGLSKQEDSNAAATAAAADTKTHRRQILT